MAALPDSETQYVQTVLRESAQANIEAGDKISGEIARAGVLLADAYAAGRKSLIFGNGGSAADSQHFAAELVGRFVGERRALPSIALTTDTSALTSIGNDYGFDHIFARQLEGLGQPGDVALGISTSGNSPNVLRAMESARNLGLVTIGLAGKDGGKMRGMCDVCVIVPSAVTARIQEVHSTIIHIWCGLIEKRLFGSK